MAREIQNLRSKLAEMLIGRAKTLKRMNDQDEINRFLDNWKHFCDTFDAGMSDTVHIIDIELDLFLIKTEHFEAKRTLLNVVSYLLRTEGVICTILNYITYILVVNGHDLYSQTKRRYVKDDLEEIRKVEMSTKMQFLKHRGFGLLVREYDSTLRNDIAHHNYRIDTKGVLWVRGKSVDLVSKNDYLHKLLDFLRELLSEINANLQELRIKKKVDSSE